MTDPRNDIKSDLGVDLADLHKEFRSLSTLLVLATAFNHQGQPTLILDEKSVPQKGTRGINGKTGVVLEAIASILVRDFEVIAVTARGPCFNTDSSGHGSTSYDIVALHNDTPVSKFSAIANPHRKLRSDNIKDPGHCVLASEGKSRWPSVRDSEDYWLGLKLP
jgi:hypothetical protein